MAAWTLPAEVAFWAANSVGVLHGSNAWRLGPLLVGMLWARGRLTVASWLRAGELSDDYQGYYYFLGSLGRNVKWLAGWLLRRALEAHELAVVAVGGVRP